MGDVFDHENTDAIPVHEVTLSAFDIAQYETTFSLYDAFAEETGRELPDDEGYGRGNRAVVHVNWQDARAFCNHYGFRLPTEAEWEYAARSGGQHHRISGSDSLEAADRYARHMDNSVFHAFNVGTKLPNALSLYDMSGNVFEWIGDYYEFYPNPGAEPVYKKLDESGIRIIRGGSFKQGTGILQTFWRSGTLADVRSDAIGFRCVRSVIG